MSGAAGSLFVLTGIPRSLLVEFINILHPYWMVYASILIMNLSPCLKFWKPYELINGLPTVYYCLYFCAFAKVILPPEVHYPFLSFFLPALLKYNWHLILCKSFRSTVWLFDTCMYCEIITTITLVNISFTSHKYQFLCVVRTFKVYSW